MRKLLAIFIVILLWHLPINAANTDSDNDVFFPENIICESVNKIIKCARLPQATLNETIMGGIVINGSYIEGASFSDAATTEDENWSHYRNGISITGISHDYGTSTLGPYTVQSVNCTIKAPFSADFYVEYRTRTVNYTPPELCANVGFFGSSGENGWLAGWVPTALDGDICPDGFFTVPYESWCGEGMVNIADTPYCADDVSGEYCLMNATKPCDAGISAIKTSTGLSFTLWAEKYTAPALAVKYNNTVCWCNLESGNATGAININYDGTTYHLIN